MYINIIHHKKNSHKNTTHNPNFEMYMHFYHKYIPYVQVFQHLLEFFKWFFSFKIIKYAFKKPKNPRCDVYMLSKN
jgi:hypothetical protein